LLRIRDFSENDALTLVQISNNAFSDELARGMPQFTSEGFIKSSKRPGIRIFIAEDLGKVVGFLTLIEGNIEIPAQIHLVAVAEELRGRGIGKRLGGAAIEHVKDIGRSKLKLFTRPWNKAMSKDCLDLGFVPEAYLRREYLNADLVLYSAFFE